MILGGAQENTLLTCEGLHARGHEVTLVTGPAAGREGDLMRRATAGGYRVEVIPSLGREIAPLADAAALRALEAALRRLRPDIVHTHSSKAGILGRFAAWRVRRTVPSPGMGIVHTLHGLAFGPTASAWENAVYVRLERTAARWSDKLVSVADAMTAQALSAGVGRPDQYVTVRSGMEVGAFVAASSLRERVRRAWGVGPGELLVGQVSRLAPRKGLEDVLAVAAQVCRAIPAARFVLVGDGPSAGALRAMAGGLGISDRVRFAGLVPTPEMPGVMAALDVLIHASLREGLPRVVPQALLAGTPVVCADVDGAPEVVFPGRTGFLFPAGDVAAAAGQVSMLLRDGELRGRLAAAGREHCRREFDAGLMVDRLEGVCLDVMRERRRVGMPGPASS